MLDLYSSRTESELDREILVKKKIKKPTKDPEEALRELKKKNKKQHRSKTHLYTDFDPLQIFGEEDLCQDMAGVFLSDASDQSK